MNCRLPLLPTAPNWHGCILPETRPAEFQKYGIRRAALRERVAEAGTAVTRAALTEFGPAAMPPAATAPRIKGVGGRVIPSERAARPPDEGGSVLAASTGGSAGGRRYRCRRQDGATSATTGRWRLRFSGQRQLPARLPAVCCVVNLVARASASSKTLSYSSWSS